MKKRRSAYSSIAARLWLFAFVFAVSVPNVFAEVGVTPTTVTLGQSVPLSGLLSALGSEMRDTAVAYFDYVNKRGGVHGRSIILRTLDDANQPDRGAENTRKLIYDEGVFALFAYRSTPVALAAARIFTRAKVPMLAPFTGAKSLRDPPNPYLFLVRTSYEQEISRLIEQSATMGLKRIAVFYQNDSFGKEGFAAAALQIERRGLVLAATGTVERESIDVKQAVKDIAKTEPQAVLVIASYLAAAEFIRDLKKVAGAAAPFAFCLSNVDAKALFKKIGDDARGVAIAQVVPSPWNGAIRLTREYTSFATAENIQVGFTSLESFISAKVAVEALRRAGPNPTREKFIAALESMNNYDLGGVPLHFSPSNHNGMEFVELTVISAEGKILR